MTDYQFTENLIVLNIQPLTSELLPAILELDQLCLGGLWTLEGYQRELDSSSSHFLVLSICADESNREVEPSIILGYGCFWSIVDEAHITILAIAPPYQNQGLGALLFYSLLQLARQKGMERATLEVRASNQVALSLYKRFGFQEAGRRRKYYQDTGEDALILWRGGLQSVEFSQTLVIWRNEITDRLAAKSWSINVV